MKNEEKEGGRFMRKKRAGMKMLAWVMAVVMFLTMRGMPVLSEVAEVKAAEREMPKNPVHHCVEDGEEGDYGENDITDWSYIYFGSYPQSEIEIDEDDIESLAIVNAEYDENGDAWVGGTKYRRISKDDVNNLNHFFESDSYHYFKWERIRWRVLKNDGNTLFVMADNGLDCKCYADDSENWETALWKNCFLRDWLNNKFYNCAFSGSEQNAIVEQRIIHKQGEEYNTQDKIFLISGEDVYDSKYGFCGKKFDETDTSSYNRDSASRWVDSSEYAYCMGAFSGGFNFIGCDWWLRSANYGDYRVCSSGGVCDLEDGAVNKETAVVPALHIDINSKLWLTADDGTSGEGSSGTPAIDDIQTEKTITINGGGSAYARFYLCDEDKKPLKNTTFDYYFVKDGLRYEYVNKQTDENGAFIFPTLPLSEGESHDFEYVVSLKDSSKELYTDTYTIHASASHLAYTEEWSLSFGGGGSVEAGVSGEANKTYDRIIKLKHKADGTKDLELSLKAATDVGINAAEKLLERKYDIGDIGKTTLKIADGSISEKSKNNTQWTLLIQNYNESSEKHQELVDHFMTILFALDNSNNKMLKKALDEINVDLNTILKAKSQGSSVEVGVGASLVVVDIKIGSLYYKQTSKLFPANRSTTYTYNTTKDFQEDRTGYEMGISAEKSLNLFSNSLLDAFGYSGFNTLGFEGFYKLKTSSISVNEEEIKLKSEDLDQKYDGLAGDKVSKIYTFTVKDEEADLLKNKNENFKKLGEGRSGLLDVGQIRNMADDVLQCNKITYTESDKTKVKVSGKFGAKIAEVFSIGLNYSATRTTTVETTGGEKDKDGLYCTWKNDNNHEGVSGSYAVTDLDTILKPNSLKWLEKIKNSIVSVVGNTAEAVVRNVKAKINQTKTKYLVTITMLKDLSENLFSMENTRGINENSDQKTELVGNAYSVYITDTEENEIERFDEEPIMLELSYNEEDFQNAGLTLEEAELLHIGKYNAESNAYDDMGGILDEENQLVKLSITEPGQYVLMVDQEAPEISFVTLTDATSRPTIGAYISDIGGISGIELWIDGNLLIDAKNYMEFYNPLTETLVYEVENALIAGNHAIRLKAADSFGNESEYFEKSFPVAGTPQITEVNIPTSFQNRIDMNVLVDGYAIHCVEANVVETLSDGTEESKVYALNDNGNKKWNLTLENVNAKKCAIEIVVYDLAGNMVKSSIYESNYKSGSQKPGTGGSSSVKNPGNSNSTNTVRAPEKIKLKNLKSVGKGKLKVNWKWVISDGFQIQYALNKKFTKSKRTKHAGWLDSSIRLKKLKSKKKYFVRIRAYNVDYSGRVIYGPWSNVKKCKVK